MALAEASSGQTHLYMTLHPTTTETNYKQIRFLETLTI